jgi:adenylate cyclase, class 2
VRDKEKRTANALCAIKSDVARTANWETEIKLRISAGARAAARLLDLHGYVEKSPRTLQADQLFDLPDLALRNSSRLLRLRSEGSASVLTYKGPPRPGLYKSREELETPVTSGRTLKSILRRLGYNPSFRYEKYRTTFQKPGEDRAANVALDETPIGVFLELEGPADWIDRTARELGFSTRDYIIASYGSLYREYVKRHGGPADMRFRESRKNNLSKKKRS